MHKIFNDNAINNLRNALSTCLADIKKYEFANTYAIKCGKIYIRSCMGEPVIDVGSDLAKSYINDWYSTPIRILLKDLKKNTLDDYYIVNISDIFYLIKQLNSDDLNYLKKKNITNSIDFVLGNNNYAVISISNNDRFSYECFDKYDYQNIIENEDNEEPEDEGFDSVQLFDDIDIYE